ncbi:MAG TPA: hypothetical protein VKZ60_04780 [Chloroflexota bacterium]|jgi:hypothetical protein|nr:hypothetical protein [Chloroflexota bacterium]
MASIALAFPILPGQIAAARQFAQACMGPRRAELAASYQEHGITHEEWFLQEGPAGAAMIVYFEADDPARSLRTWAASQAPFDRWFKAEARACTGIDFDQPLAALPEPVLAWP